MKNIISIFILSYTLISSSIFAQNYVLYGDRCFGGNNAETDCRGILHDSTHLIIVGRSLTNINGNKTDPFCDSLLIWPDIWALKIDTAFNIVWNKSIGGAEPDQYPYIIKNALNDLYIISCHSESDSSCEKTELSQGGQDYWIYNLENNGSVGVDYDFGGNSTEGCPKTIQLQSGNFITCGLSGSPVSGDKSVSNYGANDYWVIKYDSLGNKIWDNVYGGTGVEYGCGFNYEYNFDVIADQGDQFIIAGTTNSPVSGNISDSSRGQKDIWVILVDANGNKIWDKRFGGTLDDKCQRILKSSDNGFLLCGNSKSPQGGDVSDPLKSISSDCWIIKLDSLGNKQWDKRYGGDLAVSGTWIENAPDSGYWISGWVQGGIANDVSEQAYGIQQDYFIFKIDNNGNKIWDKRFGGSGLNYGSSFVIMPDKSIFLFGHSDTSTSQVKTDPGHGLEDYWIVHFKYDDATGINEHSTNQKIDIYPNPTSGIINIPSNIFSSDLVLYDITGRILFQFNDISTSKLDFSSLNSGSYFLKFVNGKKTYWDKLIIQK